MYSKHQKKAQGIASLFYGSRVAAWPNKEGSMGRAGCKTSTLIVTSEEVWGSLGSRRRSQHQNCPQHIIYKDGKLISYRAQSCSYWNQCQGFSWLLLSEGSCTDPWVQQDISVSPASSCPHSSTPVHWWHGESPTDTIIHPHVHTFTDVTSAKNSVFKRDDGKKLGVFKKVEASLRETMPFFFHLFKVWTKRLVGWINILFFSGVIICNFKNRDLKTKSDSTCSLIGLS